MAGLLPSEFDEDWENSEGDPRVVGVDTSDADAVLGALSSETARRILTVLHEQPATPSELADRADTSLQNAQYHLEKLDEADLIEVQGTRYSAKGREMNVYGPTDGPLVLFAGDEEESAGVEAALAQLLGGIGVLSLTGGALNWWLSRTTPGAGGGGASGPMTVAPDAVVASSGASPAGTSAGAQTALGAVESLLLGLPGLEMVVAGAALLGALWAVRRQ